MLKRGETGRSLQKMKAVVQRVLSASVTVEGQVVSSIGKGLLVLVGLDRYDEPADSAYIIKKVLQARLFDDETSGAMWKKSVKDIEGEVLCVSQFTLLASMKKGSKPDFHQAMTTSASKDFYAQFLSELGDAYEPQRIKDGEFGAMMQVGLVNDGPVTILLDSKEKKSTSSSASSVVAA